MNKDNSSINVASDDRLFLGEGLFETIKIDEFAPCFPDLHWERLKRSATQLGISFTLSKADWRHLLTTKVQEDRIQFGGIKVILTGGKAARGLTARGSDAQLIITSFHYMPTLSPLSLISAPWQRDQCNPVYRFKTINYLESILARRGAIEHGADDALFFNTKEHATEATCANLFIIYHGTILTPCLHDGVLPGIMRWRVLKHCAFLSVHAAEQSITKEMIDSAEAVFLTNSIQGIQYVSSLDKTAFLTAHPVVELLMQSLMDEDSTSE